MAEGKANACAVPSNFFGELGKVWASVMSNGM